MSDVSYATRFTVDASPKDVYAAITNARGWWAEEIDGDTAEAGDEFVQRYGDMHRCRIRITEAVPERKVSWLVLENYFSFTEDQTEWAGTTITFDITEKDGETEVAFTHQGLLPVHECYDVCSNAWGFHVNSSLRALITTGKGEPSKA